MKLFVNVDIALQTLEPRFQEIRSAFEELMVSMRTLTEVHKDNPTGVTLEQWPDGGGATVRYRGLAIDFRLVASADVEARAAPIGNVHCSLQRPWAKAPLALPSFTFDGDGMTSFENDENGDVVTTAYGRPIALHYIALALSLSDP